MPRRSSPLTPQYGWDDKAGRYTNLETGRYVKSSAVKSELESVITRSEGNITALGEMLKTGSIGIGDWQKAMLQEIKTVHIAQSAAANGGWAQMSQSDWGHVGARLKQEYRYLQGFAAQLEDGTQPLNGRFDVRANMYAKAGRGSFEDTRRRYQENRNAMTEERRVLMPGESCRDCLDYASMGWRPIGTLPRIGNSQCLTNCNCRFEYRKVDADGNEIMAEED